MSFEAEEFTSPICIRGVVAATPDNTGNAILGVNLNQTNTSDMTVQTVAPKLDGIAVSISNGAGSPVRLQIQALDGASNDRARWCASVRGSGGFIPWSAFNTACWDGTGLPYRREAISGAMLLIPGATDKPTNFDVCLIAIAEASTPAAQPAAGSGG